MHFGDIVIARGVAARQAREHGHAEPVELRVLALHGLLHLLGYDHEQDAGRMRRVEARLRRRGRPADRPHRAGRSGMIAGVRVLVLLAIAAVYVGTIEAAFSALMRLSLRLTAERNGRAGGLGRYLDDPGAALRAGPAPDGPRSSRWPRSSGRRSSASKACSASGRS